MPGARVLALKLAGGTLFLLVVLAGVVAFILMGGSGAPAFPGALSPAPEAALAPGSPGALRQAQDSAWDSRAVHAPSVVRLPTIPGESSTGQAGTDRGYFLWYDGADSVDPYSGWAIGLATSQDGLRWERRPENPVLSPGPPGSWDGASVHDPRVVWDGRRFLMWYSGYDGARWRIGLASSDDGVRWAKHPGNPVLEPGPPGSWDGASVAYSSVVVQDGGYRMWYQGGDSAGVWRIGYATSQDGVHWRKSDRNPVLSPGPESAWDAGRVFTPHVLPWGVGYLMLYTGGPGAGIGYAFSTDVVSWRKAPKNPALRAPQGVQARLLSQASLRPDGQVLTVTALLEGEKLVVWYAEHTGGQWTIRRAEAVVR